MHILYLFFKDYVTTLQFSNFSMAESIALEQAISEERERGGGSFEEET